jgi:hypothetical protein
MVREVDSGRKRAGAVRAIRGEAREADRRRIASIRKKIQQDFPLNDDEKKLLSSFDWWTSEVRKVGAPEQLAVFHTWMAAHYLWLSLPEFKNEKTIVAYRLVGDKWKVSKTAIAKAVKKHKTAALQLERSVPDAFVEKFDEKKGVDLSACAVVSVPVAMAVAAVPQQAAQAMTAIEIRSSLGIMADAFIKLGELTVEEIGRASRPAMRSQNS